MGHGDNVQLGDGGDGRGGASGASDAGADSGGQDLALPVCAERFMPTLGSAAASTSGEPSTFSLSCAPGSSDDVSFYWVAPRADYYQIDTRGSTFDTALGLVSPACDGVELACNDEGSSAPQSEILRKFAAGEAVVIVVDGKVGTFGEVALNVAPIACPSIDLNLQSPPISSTTLDGTNFHEGACGGANRLEKAFRWAAPSAGLYRFEVSSQAMTPALYLERGPRCGGQLLGCNIGALRSAASVVRQLERDEVVTLIVEGVDADGTFDLAVKDLAPSACPSGVPLLYTDEITATLEPGDPSVLTGSCAPDRQSALPSGDFALPEHSYPLTTEGGFACDVGIIANAPVAVYILEGLKCGGRELGCQRVTAIDTLEFIDVDLGDFEGSYDYVVVVEAIEPVTGPATYTLIESCATP